MRWNKFVLMGLILPLAALVFGISIGGAQDTIKDKFKILPIKPPDIVLKFPAPKVKGIDPAAVTLMVEVEKKLSAFEAEVTIIGIIRNIGTEDFKSRKGQQAAYLNEENPGAKPRLVAKHEFTNLKSGGYFTVHFRRKWSTSMEFPPSYRLVLSYDPDINIDSNKFNDDVNTKNNQKTLSGTTIMATVQKALKSK